MTGKTLTRHKTRIVATIGPASESPEMLVRLIRAGLESRLKKPGLRRPDSDAS